MIRLTQYLSQFSSSLLFPSHSVQCSECTYKVSSPTSQPPGTYLTYTSTSTMVATLAIDHTITHDLPPYPSLSPVHRAKRENKMVEFSYPSLHTHNTYRYMYIHIHICCTTSSAQPTYWHVVQFVSTPHPSSSSSSLHEKRHEVTRTFDDDKDLWNYVHVHVHDMYISLGWGWLVLLPTCSMSSICQYLEDYRPCHHHEIYNSTLMYFYRIQYLIHHATSIAMTSDLLPPSACIYLHR